MTWCHTNHSVRSEGSHPRESIAERAGIGARPGGWLCTIHDGTTSASTIYAVETDAAADHRSRAMTIIQTKLGRAVRRLRSRAEYSQESFAAAAGIHRTYMGLVERGRVAATIVTIEKISTALGITASELLAEAERER